MERIMGAIFSSKYSIHDLSRCKGEGDEHLARFNMPLELGIAMGRRYSQTRRAERHDWLPLVPEEHQYARFISDLIGFDPYCYDGTVNTLIPKVMAWLTTRPDGVRPPQPQAVLAALPAFTTAKMNLMQQWRDTIPWGYIVEEAQKAVPSM